MIPGYCSCALVSRYRFPSFAVCFIPRNGFLPSILFTVWTLLRCRQSNNTIATIPQLVSTTTREHCAVLEHFPRFLTSCGVSSTSRLSQRGSMRIPRRHLALLDCYGIVSCWPRLGARRAVSLSCCHPWLSWWTRWARRRRRVCLKQAALCNVHSHAAYQSKCKEMHEGH